MVVQVSESVVIFREFRSRNCSVCAAIFNASLFYNRDFIITLHDLWLEEQRSGIKRHLRLRSLSFNCER